MWESSAKKCRRPGNRPSEMYPGLSFGPLLSELGGPSEIFGGLTFI